MRWQPTGTTHAATRIEEPPRQERTREETLQAGTSQPTGDQRNEPRPTSGRSERGRTRQPTAGAPRHQHAVDDRQATEPERHPRARRAQASAIDPDRPARTASTCGTRQYRPKIGPPGRNPELAGRRKRRDGLRRPPERSPARPAGPPATGAAARLRLPGRLGRGQRLRWNDRGGNRRRRTEPVGARDGGRRRAVQRPGASRQSRRRRRHNTAAQELAGPRAELLYTQETLTMLSLHELQTRYLDILAEG